MYQSIYIDQNNLFIKLQINFFHNNFMQNYNFVLIK